MQGTRLTVTFPTDVYNFLQELSKKMVSVPAKSIGPDGQFHPITDPITGGPVHMSKTGKVEEFIHMSMLQGIMGAIMGDQTDPTFLPERMKLNTVLDSYGKYIQKFLGVSPNNNEKKGV